MIIVPVALSALVIIADRLTKAWALRSLCQNQVSLLGDYISCILTYNRGVSWSLLSFNTVAGFWAVTALVSAVIICLLVHALKRARTGSLIIGESLVIGGALSNLYDRLVYGGVIDFILFQYNDWSFPVFNVADVAIVVGVIVMVYALSTE